MPVDALASARESLFGVSGARGVVFSAALGGPGLVHVLSSSERGPFAIVVRGGSPVWASREGIFASEADGTGRRRLVDDPTIRALAASPHGIVYSTGSAIFRMEWPQAANPTRLAEGVVADEVAATSEAVVWLERSAGTSWTLALESGARHELARGQREPHDLSLASDGRTVLWHESAPTSPRAFTADTVSRQVRELAGAYESDARYLLRSSCLVTPGACKAAALVDWTRLQASAPGAPLTDDASAFYWATAARGPGGKWDILSSRKDRCCP